ncbi:hypothetical protein J2X31_002705 [Flavobacterium arsenatis]|uniref:Outer membrane protein beta-barrel domain-containing protein n=1 Tax=Flavobacterium arsenatis TaxID=1484332 RepID=A0ABU1TS25_9FLAO|nr:hypothetical protein [Flavobacterium arsenatis]MDR6968679.1 hypothetical protein [Flavobacterium arsenatis]
MNDKKNIDRLFQEKFKDFEVEPNEQIWINIDAALREKKKRRVVPIWFRLTGIAAALILGFFAFTFLFNDSTFVEENQVVIGNEKQPNNNNSIESPENESIVNSENSNDTNGLENTENTINSSSINQKKKDLNEATSESDNAVVNQTGSHKNKKEKVNSGISQEENNAVATTSTTTEKSSTKKKKIRNSIAPQNQEDAVVDVGLKTEKSKKIVENANSEKTNSNSNASENNAVANNELKLGKNEKASQNNNIKSNNSISKSEGNNAVAIQDKKNPDNSSVQNTLEDKFLKDEKSNTTIAVNQKSTIDQNSINNDNFTTIDVAKKDSTAVATVEPNALEELLKKNEKEEKMIAEAKMNRWQITSNVAPIYFSSTSNGSPIDGQFAENSKSYENNLSFGVGVNYAVNKKISVRTGVNKFTLGYNTNDVVFFAAMDQVSFANVASSAAGSTIQVLSMNNSEALRPFNNGIQNTNEGTMTQRMGYFEVPVEMSYKLIDKKFGVNLIGGLSTLFLNENEVTVASSTMSASLGRAKNLNDVHFSTNVGLGFRYRFLKSFEANFEPMFKYQINTFNKDAGNFKPYFIGLYSGVSFNF